MTFLGVLCGRAQPRDLEGMLRLHRDRRPAATLGVYQVPDPRRCGIVTTNADGVIEASWKSPSTPAAIGRSQA